MSVSVSMPQLGESVTEGTVTRWLKKEGELVERDEPLLEISTDKVDTEIPSPASGILRGIAVAEDETVAVGAELASIDEDEGAGQPEAAPAQAGPATDGSGSGQAGGPAPAAQAQQPAEPAQAQQPAAAPAPAAAEPGAAPGAESDAPPPGGPDQAQPDQAQPD